MLGSHPSRRLSYWQKRIGFIRWLNFKDDSFWQSIFFGTFESPSWRISLTEFLLPLEREMSKVECWVIVWIRVNEIHWFIDFSQAEQTSECVQKKREKEKERVNKSILLFFSSKYLGDVCSLTVDVTRTCTKKRKRSIAQKKTRDFFVFLFPRRFLHCCWIG